VPSCHEDFSYLGLSGARSFQPSFVDFLTHCAQNDRFKRHALVHDAAAADAILITEAWRHFDDWKFSRVRRALTAPGRAHKTFVYYDTDDPLYVGPGLYPSITRPVFDPYNQSSFCYLGEHTRKFENDDDFSSTQPDLLFSFAGTVQNHASRREVMKLQDKRAELFDSTAVQAAQWRKKSWRANDSKNSCYVPSSCCARVAREQAAIVF
jgi:hypothetical protein